MSLSQFLALLAVFALAERRDVAAGLGAASLLAFFIERLLGFW